MHSPKTVVGFVPSYIHSYTSEPQELRSRLDSPIQEPIYPRGDNDSKYSYYIDTSDEDSEYECGGVNIDPYYRHSNRLTRPEVKYIEKQLNAENAHKYCMLAKRLRLHNF